MVVHGDDLLSVGEEGDQSYLLQLLQAAYDVKAQTISEDGPVKELRMRGRAIAHKEGG